MHMHACLNLCIHTKKHIQKSREITNHSGAELVEKAKHGYRFRNFEARVSASPFTKAILCNVYTLYRWKRHYSQGRATKTLEKKMLRV